MRVSPKTLLLASSLAAIVAAPCFLRVGDASAQTGALTSYPACTAKPSPQDSDSAHSAYLLGKRFFEESDYTSASHNFVDAFKLDCSKPELLLNIARANELLGNRQEAIHALETYMARATNLDGNEKASLQRRIDNLKAAIAAQTPTPVPTVVAPLPPPPAATTAAPPPPPAPPPPAPSTEDRKHTTAPWVVTGVGAAAAVTGGILYFVGNGKVSTAEKSCAVNAAGDYTCPSGAASSGTTGDHLKTAGEGVFWAGLAVAGGGLLWHFLEPTGPTLNDKPDAPKTSFSPMVGPGLAGASVVGSF